MGIDVNLYAETAPSPEQLAQAEAYMRRHCTIADWEYEGVFLRAQDADEWGAARVTLNTLARYFAPTYPRGWWPDIFEAILLMQTVFPEARVFYGGDGSDDGEPVTDEMLTENWATFTAQSKASA